MKGNGRALMDVPVIGDIIPYLILIWLVIQVAFPLIRAGYRFVRDLEKSKRNSRQTKFDSEDVKKRLIGIGSAVLAGEILIGGLYAIGRLILFRK